MKLSLNWLSNYIDLKDIDITDIANKVTMSTCEIEDIYKVFEIDPHIVIGKVLECTKHPESDKLTICKVDDGKSVLQIVCGASNVKENIYVPLAKIGSKLKINNEIVIIQNRKIKGIDSYGMICSTQELGLDVILGNNDGILILDKLDNEIFEYAYKTKSSTKSQLNIDKIKKEFLKPGKSLKELFPYEDTILEIDNKSITHRPDLWGHIGFAMELSAILEKELYFNPLYKKYTIKENAKLPHKEIIIKNKSAISYNGVVCKNIEVKPSPLWRKILLSAIDQKLINNIVDISNFVMYELGQPNHIFDYNTLKANSIVCDLTSKEIEFAALDGEIYKIPTKSIIIYDGKNPIALGGIIGGLNSAIKEDTKDIFIESATFPREYIRKTISVTGIRTESSRRFEKGLDPTKSRIAIFRILELIKETNPMVQIGKIQYNFTEKIKQNKIKTNIDFIQMKLGFPISIKEVQNILKRLHFKVKIQNKNLYINVPSFRSYYDITIEEDIVEEIGRIYGYDNIQPIAPKVEIKAPILPYERYFERQIKYFISANGLFYETMNYSFAKKEDNLLFGYEGIQLLNPAQKNKDRIRVSLIPGLLEQLQLNINRYEEAGLYELGKVFIPKDKIQKNLKENLPKEIKKLSLIYFTQNISKYKIYLFKNEDLKWGVLLYIRHLIENLLNFFHIEYELSIPEDPIFYLHPKSQIDIYHKDIIIGHLGILHPEWIKKYDFPEAYTIVIADLNFDSLFTIWNQKRIKKETHYKPPSTFPKSTFDFTIIMNIDESTKRPIKLIENLFPEVQSIELLDIYIGNPIPEGKKSVSYRVHCLDYKSITGERLQKILDTIVQILQENGFPLRT